MADWVSDKVMMDVFRKTADQLKNNPHANVYLNFGFHDSSADAFLPKLERVIDAIRETAARESIPLEMARFPLEIPANALDVPRSISAAG